MALDRMEGFSDRGDEENVSSSSSSAAAAFGVVAPTAVATTSMACKGKCVALYERRHDDFEVCSVTGPPERGLVWKLRRQKGSRTICVALVLCLGRHSDPPEVMKTLTCARMECWIDPFSVAPGKALELIGKALHTQYKRWQPDASYELQLDPTVDAVKILCTSCRNFTKSERILFHYNGHGVPEPTANGEIWLFNKSYTRYILLPVRDLDSWLKTPSMYVFDCSFAGRIVDAFIEHQDGNSAASSSTRDCILLAACGAHETLPQSDKFPADLFTSCLTTPIKMALRWLHSRSLHCDEINDTLIDKIPGSRKDRKTLLGELHCIFTAITDAIAWDVLPHARLENLNGRSFPEIVQAGYLSCVTLFRNFLLAERIMRPLNCSPVSFPVLPSTNQHHLWDAWDMAAEICLSQLPSLIDDPNAKFQPSPFFTDQLTAFEIWLDHGSEHKKPPEQLPIVINTVLSHYHRNRALGLLGRFFDMGPWAVDLALSLGIYAYLLKLLQTTERDIQPLLVFLWAKILALDKSCQADLVKGGGYKFFIKFLDSTDACTEKRAMAAFVLALIVDRHHEGLGACIQADLIPVCLRRLQLANPHDAQAEPLLRQWLCLCLGKLWEDFPEAQMIGLQADALATFASLLLKSQPEVRASAVFALGMLLDVGNDSLRDETGVDDECDDDEKTKAELIIVKSLLEVVADGSPMVRAEVVVALARFAFVHNKHLKPIAATDWKPQPHRLLTSLPSLPNIKIPNYGYGSVGHYTHSGSPVLRIGRDRTSSVLRGRVSMSSPLASTGIMCGSPQSNDSSQHSNSGALLKDHASSGDTNFLRSKPLDNTMYTQCVLAMCTLAKDPSPRIANLGQRMLSMIGIKQVVTKALQPDGPIQPGDSPATSQLPSLHEPARLPSSWDMTAGHSPLTFRTPPVSPPRQSLTGMQQVSSLEFSPLWMNSPNLGLADPILGLGGSGSECSLLPQSTIHYWSCDHFSRSPVTAADDEEEIFAKREVRERYAINRIAKCQQYSVNKFSTEIASWDTKFETGTKVALLHPFDPIVVATDKDEHIRVWNYDKCTLLNSFNDHEVSDKGISKLCLVNELNDSLLLVASCNGNIRIWKNYSINSKQKLVTAFSSIQDHEHGVQIVNAVVDWQQQSGYLYASGDISSIRLWDLEKEQRVYSLSSLSESRISALSASQVHGHLIATGFVDGSVRIFDIRTPDIPVCITRPHNKKVERVVGVGFQPGLDPSKIVSASQAGDIRFLDIRNESKTYLTIDAHRGSLTALAIHRHAPVIASGSAKKTVKVFSLQGGQPSVTIQRTGSVSCLTFHPYRVQLAVGADDAHVSFFSDDTPHSR